eukprot:GILI01017908.1.p1 GENE.GILI01017908.1~~GILI01017908.1.p1  ORF type:complete len:132 (+),score=37.64 GILI01017908.1:59-454(+)
MSRKNNPRIRQRHHKYLLDKEAEDAAKRQANLEKRKAKEARKAEQEANPPMDDSESDVEMDDVSSKKKKKMKVANKLIGKKKTVKTSSKAVAPVAEKSSKGLQVERRRDVKLRRDMAKRARKIKVVQKMDE